MATKGAKRVDAVDSRSGSVLVRARDGSAFAKCDECKKDVPVALISMHDCSLEAKIKMNLDAQVIEQAAEAKKPERKKPKSKEPNAKRAKVGKVKKVKDPNMPKRPPTAFFVFMDDFRKTFKEANPDSKDVKRVGKEAGEKWRSLTDEEKKPYLDRVIELKAEYEKAMEIYNATEKEDQEEGSDKSDKEAPATVEVEELTDEE
ncbi:high mobility group B1 [Trifolium repens]|nr:high mobility group B1 [Trifolium repens]